jgi:hypothetical protein
MPPTKISITLDLLLAPLDAHVLREILVASAAAAEILRKISDKHRTTHQVALHHLAYRALTSLDPDIRHPSLPQPLPAQYAHRAIQRFAHQARALRAKQPDPYPPNSFDIDSRCADIRLADSALAITRLDARGCPPGFNRDIRHLIPYSVRSKSDDKLLRLGRLLGATISLDSQTHAQASLRLEPDQPEKPSASDLAC